VAGSCEHDNKYSGSIKRWGIQTGKVEFSQEEVTSMMLVSNLVS
jgi:hypothetical protein